MTRIENEAVAAVLVPSGTSRTSARHISSDGVEMIVPLPAQIEGQAA